MIRDYTDIVSAIQYNTERVTKSTGNCVYTWGQITMIQLSFTVKTGVSGNIDIGTIKLYPHSRALSYFTAIGWGNPITANILRIGTTGGLTLYNAEPGKEYTAFCVFIGDNYIPF